MGEDVDATVGVHGGADEDGDGVDSGGESVCPPPGGSADSGAAGGCNRGEGGW